MGKKKIACDFTTKKRRTLFSKTTPLTLCPLSRADPVTGYS